MIRRDHIPAMGLGVSQIMGYGVLYYAYAILLPAMAQDLGLTLSQIFGILSLAVFFGGAFAPIAGMLTDKFGGRVVMTAGALVAGLSAMAIARVEGSLGLFMTILVMEAAAMFVLYPVAFAAIARLDLSVHAQRSISIITLLGGIASTIFWPLTLWLYEGVDWRTTWLILGAAYLVVCLPIHWLSLKGRERQPDAPRPQNEADWPELVGTARKRGMIWMVASFLFSGYLMGAVMTLWVTNVQDLGHSAALAALAGAVIGPFKTIGRLFEMVVSRSMYPLATYALALCLTLAGFGTILAVGFTVPGILIGAAFYGMGDGIKTIARGTLPLALFGHKGYGARLGWISAASMAANASAPFVFAWISQSFGGWWSFAVMSTVLLAAILTSLAIPDPRRLSHAPVENRRLPESR